MFWYFRLKFLKSKSIMNQIATNLGLLLLRVGMSAGMLTHGYPKLLKLINGDFKFADPIGIGPKASLILAVICEVVFPILVIIGFKTKIASVPVIITMAVALFVFHANDSFSTKENAFLYLLGFIVVALLGAGKYSIDKK